ncbi:MAG: hypothetical protein Q8M83_04060 [bacterium]|nr:hypothetical protein [bacterium]
MKKLLNWKYMTVLIAVVLITPCSGQAKGTAATKTIQTIFSPAPLCPKKFKAVEFEEVEAGDILQLIEYQGNYLGDVATLAPEVETMISTCHKKMTQECGAQASVIKLLLPESESLDAWPQEIRTILEGLIGSWNIGFGGILQVCARQEKIVWNYLPLAPDPGKTTPRKASFIYVTRGFCAAKK